MAFDVKIDTILACLGQIDPKQRGGEKFVQLTPAKFARSEAFVVVEVLPKVKVQILGQGF